MITCKLPDSPRTKLANFFLHPNLVLAVYCLAALIATIIKLAPGPFEQNGIHYQPLQNFAIFRNSFYHLIHHQNLYAQFDFEQWDFYRYSPAFALLFAPFALLPYAIGAVLWNLLNAASLYWAVRWVPIARRPSKNAGAVVHVSSHAQLRRQRAEQRAGGRADDLRLVRARAR